MINYECEHLKKAYKAVDESFAEYKKKVTDNLVKEKTELQVCLTCPHRVAEYIGWGGRFYYCYLEGIHAMELDKLNTTPDWCPLLLLEQRKEKPNESL